MVAGFLLQCWWVWRYTMDDAFISFRYAKHIADGIGPVWNLADRARPVEGFTSFLHVWLLGARHYVMGGDLVVTGKVLGVVASLVLAGSVTHEVVRRGLGSWGALVALSFLVLPFTALNSVSGMETSLFLLWNWLCAITCVRLLETPGVGLTWRFVLFGLLGTLTRPEFVPAFGLMAAYVWWRRPAVRPALTLALAVLYVLPGVAVTTWRYAYYGDVVPNAFYVKQTKRLSWWGMIYVARFVGFLALPYALLVLAGWRGLWAAHRELLVVVGINVGIAVGYFTTTVPLMGWWYRFLLPQLPLLAVCAAVAVSTRGRPEARRLVGWRAAALAALVLSTAAHVPLIARFLVAHEAHEARYREVGKRLRPFAATDRWLVYHDVGSLVYEAEWNTVDVVGLNTRLSELKLTCEMRTDLVMTFGRSGPPAAGPCPSLYVAIADLPFSREERVHDSYMRVFVRQDVAYASELKRALLDGWPEPLARPFDWLAWYSQRFQSVFFQ